MTAARTASGAASRHGLTLLEVVIGLTLLGGVLLGLGAFSARLSQATSLARLRITAQQLASDRLEAVKGAPRYAAIESLYVATESPLPGYPQYTRQTFVQHVGGAATDTIDYKIVTVQVTNPQMPGAVRRTTVIAPF